jgi:hypothetical protein
MAIIKKFIGRNQVGSQQILLEQAQSLRASGSVSGQVVELLKYENSKLKLLETPQYAAAPIDASDLVNKAYADTKISRAELGVSVATLTNGVLSAAQIPSITITDTFVVNSELQMLALNLAEKGDVAIRTDENKTYILASDAFGGFAVMANWVQIRTPDTGVASVNGQFGPHVILNSDNIAEGLLNLYFTGARARTETLVSSILGNESVSDRAPVVSAIVGYVTGKVFEEETRARAAEQLLYSQIQAEAAARIAADEAEAFARQAADQAEAQARIDGDFVSVQTSKAYTDSELDKLTVQKLEYVMVDITPGMISSGFFELGFDIIGVPWLMTSNVMLKPGEDFTYAGKRITFSGDLLPGQYSALEDSDFIHVWYMRETKPYMGGV